MTILEAIQRVDTNKPNGYTQSDKIRWLDTIDRIIKAEIIDPHEGGENIIFAGYDDSTDTSASLLAPEPYSELYIFYLMAQIDFYNEEFSKYNNTMSAFNAAFERYRNFYNKQHLAKGRSIKYF